MGMKLFPLKYMMVYLIPLMVWFSLYQKGWYAFIVLAFVFGLIPLLELFLPGTKRNLSEIEEEIEKENRFYDLILFSLVPMQYFLWYYFLQQINAGDMTWYESLGMITAFGVSCGVLGINAAHELGHRQTWYEKLMSKMLLATTLYLHFFIEHNRGHHRNVATDLDPASGKWGESIYVFFIRTIRDSWISAWKLEGDRLKKANLPFWSIHNEMLWYQFVHLTIIAAVASVYGLQVALLYLGSAIIGILLLETVNYIEHYGLRRRNTPGGTYERTMPIHSWNSNNPLGRILLLELTRHSDHHYMANRKYQILRHFDESPQMPTGYPGMMLLSFIPPLWFKVMHRKIELYRRTQLGKDLA
ncbi:MAG: alkane 1-monooxygenase [Saprospiraceae bacterium]|nr:alkane 1-monooxygenase [Saprospiraceae bacterium]